MSIVVLHQSDYLTLAANSRVLAAEEVGTFRTLLEQADSLSERLSAEESRLRDAELRARKDGHQLGFEAGRQEGLEAAADEMVRQRDELATGRQQVQQQALSMAFDIVRKLADTLDPTELLSSLAITASRSCPLDEPLVLRVHERYEKDVAQRLNSLDSASGGNPFRHVIGDASLDFDACIIETPSSRVVANLDTQVELLEAQLVND